MNDSLAIDVVDGASVGVLSVLDTRNFDNAQSDTHLNSILKIYLNYRVQVSRDYPKRLGFHEFSGVLRVWNPL